MNSTRKTIATALLALVFSLPLPAAVKNFYVSPTGNDNNDGLSTSAPVKSLVAAQTKVRAFIQNNTSDDVFVNLRGGEYEVFQTLVFDNRDSGGLGRRVTWQPYTDATGTTEIPVLTGGKAVSSWLDGGGGLYRLNGPGTNGAVSGRTSATKFRNFWFNGERRSWAATTVNPATTSTSWHYNTAGKRDGINVPASLLNGATTTNHGAIELSWRINWMHHRLPVKQITTSGGTSTIYLETTPLNRALALLDSYPTYWPSPDKPFVIENVWGAMAPGRWYHSISSGFFFYRLKDGETTTGAVGVYPQLAGSFIKIQGSAPANRVANLTFRGLTFRYSDLHYANTNGVLNKQAGHWFDPNNPWFDVPANDTQKEANYNAPGYQPEGAIQAENATGLVVKDNTFEHLGTAGVVFRIAVDSSEVVGNRFTDLSESAISLGNWTLEQPSAVDNQVRNITVTGNDIADVGIEYNGAPGICAYFVQDTVISHNTLENLPYTGISLGWGWDRNVASDRRPARNTISNNHVTTYMTTLFDGGGIYVLGRQPDASNGSVITGNYLVDMQSTSLQEGGAIYPDQGSRYWSINNNVVEDVNYTWLYIWEASIQNITASGNWSTTGATRNSGTSNSIDLPIVFNPDVTIPEGALNVIDRARHETRNLALDGTASASSVYKENGQELAAYKALKANDDSLGNLWSAGDAGPNKKEWWQVDLLKPHQLDRIEVYARRDMASDTQSITRKSLAIWASNDPDFNTYDVLGTVDADGNYTYQGRSQVFAFKGMWPIEVSARKPYRYVRLTKTEDDQYLTAAEVRVVGW